MKTKFFASTQLRLVTMAVFLVASIGEAAAQSLAVGSQSPDFTLKDQFDKDWKLSDYTGHGRLVLVLCWDRVGNDYMANWFNGVRSKYPSGPNRTPNPVVTLVYVANLKGVPGFMQDGIKKKYQKTSDGQTNGSILMDWNGTVPKIFGSHEDVTNVYLLDEKGVLRSSAYGKGTPEELQPLLREIANLATTLPQTSSSTK